MLKPGYAQRMDRPSDSLAEDDPAVNEVFSALRAMDPSGERWAGVIRHTYDMIYNGAETGRYRWEDIMKTERTHFGTVFEINAQREFEFEGGDATDYRIVGHQVDAKWSQTNGGWMLPPEVVDHIALVATGNDYTSSWSLGLVRVRPEYRNEGNNRDKKSTLNAAGRRAINWLWREAPMPVNILLQLPPEDVHFIFDHRHGTKRVDRLFRATEGRPVHRTTVSTVAMQLDHQKRVRYNGGARSSLKTEGYLILSGKYQALLAQAFGLPIPGPAEYVSVRVAPTDDPTGVLIGDRRWRRAAPSEVLSVPAPRISEPRSLGDDS